MQCVKMVWLDLPEMTQRWTYMKMTGFLVLEISVGLSDFFQKSVNADLRTSTSRWWGGICH